ncbi:ion transporter, partial [Oceanospirillum sp. HFRX-1_2]
MTSNHLRNRCFQLLDGEQAFSLKGKLINGFIIALIVLNVTGVILETVPEIGKVYAGYFYALELFSVAVFTVEYLVRVWISAENPKFGPGIKGKLRYIFSPIALIDLIVIIPF